MHQDHCIWEQQYLTCPHILQDKVLFYLSLGLSHAFQSFWASVLTWEGAMVLHMRVRDGAVLELSAPRAYRSHDTPSLDLCDLHNYFDSRHSCALVYLCCHQIPESNSVSPSQANARPHVTSLEYREMARGPGPFRRSQPALFTGQRL